jgi:hypothetical protein
MLCPWVSREEIQKMLPQIGYTFILGWVHTLILWGAVFWKFHHVESDVKHLQHSSSSWYSRHGVPDDGDIGMLIRLLFNLQYITTTRVRSSNQQYLQHNSNTEISCETEKEFQCNGIKQYKSFPERLVLQSTCGIPGLPYIFLGLLVLPLTSYES